MYKYLLPIVLAFLLLGCGVAKKKNLIIQSYQGEFKKTSYILENNIKECYKFKVDNLNGGIKIFYNKSRVDKSMKVSFHFKGFGFLENEPFAYILLHEINNKIRFIIKDEKYNCIFGKDCDSLQLEKNINHWLENKKGCLNEKTN